MTILCQVCGTANLEGTTYCEGCGVELSAAAAPTAAATSEAVPQEILSQVASTETEAGVVPSTPEATPQAEATLSSTESSAGAVSPTESEVGEAAPAEVLPVETVSEVAVPEAPVSALGTSVAEVPSAAPIPTGEAKLGIKKFGAPTGEFIPLQGERLVVGRFDASSGPVDIDLSALGGQEHISRRHAELYREQGRWAVRDLGSTNGVYIKRKGETGFSPRLQEPASLADGDELAFGNLMLTFHQS